MESPEFVNVTTGNVSSEHLSCIIRSRKPHQGVESKRTWLAERLKEGHVFRKLNVKEPAFIEYAPLEKAWVPVVGENFIYIYCLWIEGSCRGKGYGKQLLEYCIEDAESKKKSGICLLGAKKKKHWLTSQDFAKSFGFKTADSTDSGYELLALSFDGTNPAFSESAKKETVESHDLTIYYDMQCPFIMQFNDAIRNHFAKENVPVDFIHIDSLEKAKAVPGPFNNYAVFYKGKFQTANLIDTFALEKLMKK
jgi:GNAT superfamily N-acetyltransferase